MHINKVPNIICKNHCSKKHIMDNGLIWCEQTEIGNFCCVISDDKIKKLIDYEKENGNLIWTNKCLYCNSLLDDVMQAAVENYGVEPYCSLYCANVHGGCAGIPGSEIDVRSKYEDLMERRIEEQKE